MASRYEEREYRRRVGDRPYYAEGPYERESHGVRRYGSNPFNEPEYDEERYFGSGRQSYGEGYTGGGTRDYGQYRRGYESGYPGNIQSREFSGTFRPGDRYYRQDYPSEYGSDYVYDEDLGTRYRGRTAYGRRNFGGRSYAGGRYGTSYPESERGYMTEPGYRGEDRGWWDKASDEVSSWFGDEEAERRRRLDERRSQFRGRGPRGYVRSDERIKEDINDELTDSWTLDASDIEVQVTSGDVVLSGTVESRYEKRLAEDIADEVSGVKNVENRIRVNPKAGESGWSYSDTAGHVETGETKTGRSKSATH